MRIYNYDRETGAFLGESDARPDPLEHELLKAAARAAQQAAKDAKVPDLRKRAPLTDAEFISPPPEKFLIPALATAIAPPTAGESETAVFADGAWKIVEKENA